ncbi:MAG: helix-turn-helix domain-containing protein [Pseudonocardiaceae bacterium]
MSEILDNIRRFSVAESDAPPDGAAVHRSADQRALGQAAQRHVADRVSSGDTDPERSDPVTGDVSREHWTVPMHGLTCADSDGIVQAIAHRDGTVILDLTCGDSRITGWLDVSRAAQLSTGIWEAAGASQQLTWYLGDDHPPLAPHGSEVRPVVRRSPLHRNTPHQYSSPMPRRRLKPVNQAAATDADDTRTIGQRIRRIRNARDRSLRVIAGLAGMSKSTLHSIEHGQRDVTLSEIVALAKALEIAPSKLIRLPSLAPASRHTDAATRTAQPSSREAG